jgi:hypothetical protein
MMMSADDVLERELAKLGGVVAGGPMGAASVKWVARRLSSSSAEGTLEVPMNARDALVHAFRALTEVGELLPDETEHGIPALRAVVGSGTLGMNPAVVDLSVEPVAESLARVTIRATAKEGLIKQHTAEKAIKRVIDATGWITGP